MNGDLRVLWHWFSMGPYHFARMSEVAAQPGISLTVAETTSADDHGWRREGGNAGFELVTFSREPLAPAVLRSTAPAYAALLERVQPDVVVAGGYFEMHSCRALLAYGRRRRGTLKLVWHESAAFDHTRRWWRETLKSFVVRRFDGALLAGTAHRRYIRQLGMADDRLCMVGDCVDNAYFAREADRVRALPDSRKRLNLPEQYFLYVGRFIGKKNVPMLLRAFEIYRGRRAAAPWDLVLAGGGPDEPMLRELVRDRNIPGVVFAGVQQLEPLAAHYGLAGCMVLPSLSEPWGLVVNEALAAGIPVLISNRCGSAEDLVEEGRNGFTFDPEDLDGLAQLMEQMSAGWLNLEAMGARGREIVSAFSPRHFAERSVAHMRKLRRERLWGATLGLGVPAR